MNIEIIELIIIFQQVLSNLCLYQLYKPYNTIIIFQQVLSKLCLYQLYKPYITSGKTIPSVSLFWQWSELSWQNFVQ